MQDTGYKFRDASCIFNYFLKLIPASNPKSSPDKCAVCAIPSGEPAITGKTSKKRAKKITTIHISIGTGRGNTYTFIFGISTARVPRIPHTAPLAPSVGLAEVKLQPIPAKMPARKKMSRNFELPIFLSNAGAKKKNTNMLIRKCGMKFACRKIDVTNVQGLSITSAGIRIKCSV